MKGESPFEIDDEGVLLQTEEKGIQIVATHTVKDRILHINYQSLLAGHPVASSFTIES